MSHLEQSKNPSEMDKQNLYIYNIDNIEALKNR